jgi:starch phosphorylase
MKNPKFAHAFEVVIDLPEPLQPLKKLAANYRWTWDHESRNIFRAINKQLWHQFNHNPELFLNSLSHERLAQLAHDAAFVARLNRAVEGLDKYLADGTWFGKTYPELIGKATIAYFCAEFGISESLPIYSGGLGILAGDHLKAASDLGIPLVGVGLLYNRGYFRQRLTPDGWQQEIYPEYDFYQMPLTLIRDETEQPLRIAVELPDRVVTCQLWRAEVGKIPLFLLDSNVLENAPQDQDITDTLYGGDEEMRIRQEIILGVGGMRALKAVGISPTVCHMNEGHAAFLTVERIRQFMEEHNCDYRTARKVVVSGNVFTTHTPVPAGFDLFQPHMLERYMGKTLEKAGIPFADFVKMGRIDPENEGEAFNMALLAMSNANHVNGVSKLHAAVTRSMFGDKWPGYPESEVPVIPVTNGIHTMSWVSAPMADLFDNYLGVGWRRNPEVPEAWSNVDAIPEDELWAVREHQRNELVRYIRKRMQLDREQRTLNRPDWSLLTTVLDPRVLTIGFARRFATYKRGSLMLRDRERIKSLLFHSERPVQIVIAGKAHPRDEAGKKIIQDLVNFINKEGAGSRMVFLEDYDMRVARMMVQGVDLWLNNPRRPYEASGTSGMKVVPNGGLNCSVLDGWWDEGFDPSVGWAIGDRTQSIDEGHQDWLDSVALYGLIENEIAPLFYHRVDGGVPKGWVQMMKRSIKKLAPEFSTSRMVRDYTTTSYAPAAEAYLRLIDNGLARATSAREWRDRVRDAWGQVRVVNVSDSARVVNSMGGRIDLRAQVALGSLTPEDVRVQAVVGKIGPNRELTQTSPQDLALGSGVDGLYNYEGSIVAEIPGYQGYTVRVVPKHEDVSVPNELSLVAWEG